MGSPFELVTLDKDHPGFRDLAYRERRNEIAHLAETHVPGTLARDVPYIAEELDVWGIALDNLGPLHQRYACEAFHRCWPALGFSKTHIPQFKQVNAVLGKATGFTLNPVAGLVSPRKFMEELAHGRFLATQYMRHHSAPLYTPEPDVIHELVGHAALLADPVWARLNRLFGEATLKADDVRVEGLIRAYWYALEFGAIRQNGAVKVVGAGLLSSFGELGRFEKEAELRPFDLEVIARTPFDPTEYQRLIFVAESEQELVGALERWLTA